MDGFRRTERPVEDNLTDGIGASCTTSLRIHGILLLNYAWLIVVGSLNCDEVLGGEA